MVNSLNLKAYPESTLYIRPSSSSYHKFQLTTVCMAKRCELGSRMDTLSSNTEGWPFLGGCETPSVGQVA